MLMLVRFTRRFHWTMRIRMSTAMRHLAAGVAGRVVATMHPAAGTVHLAVGLAELQVPAAAACPVRAAAVEGQAMVAVGHRQVLRAHRRQVAVATHSYQHHELP